MLYSYIEKLYAYNHWANEEVLKSLQTQNVTDEYCLKMFSHVINAQFIWHRRVSEQPNDYKIWDVWSFEQMQNALIDNRTRWATYFAKLNEGELERTFSYQNSAGDSFVSRILDCIMHCVNHATHHRAQVGRRLRELGLQPVSTDYITYCRITDNI
ncbi:MAG: hypothetical protein EAZ95_16330 [Bacteroidetes bacterium]|nr:MAG: hypothetical protein EAZ95_16330 [Bacteroidota bacterium]